MLAFGESVFIAVAPCARAADAPPSNLEGSISGRAIGSQTSAAEMYELRWINSHGRRVTDVLRAGQSDSELKAQRRSHGWESSDKSGSSGCPHPEIYLTIPAQVVRFGRRSAIVADLFSGTRKAFRLSISLTRNVPGVFLNNDRASYKARLLALAKGASSPCSDRYNTIALKDPQHDGWFPVMLGDKVTCK